MSLHKMGFLHSMKVQNNPHPLPHLSLLTTLFTSHNQLSYQRCFEQKLNRHQHNNNPVSKVPKKNIAILLPYLLGLQSNQIAKRLKSCVYKCYSCVNLKIIFRSTRYIKSFFPCKDRINRSQTSRII